MECVIEGCDQPQRQAKYGWCERHYGRWRRHGDPLAGEHRATAKQKLDFVLLAVLEPHSDSDPCVLWPFPVSRQGYGYLNVDGRWTYAHQFVLEKRNGPAPFEDAMSRHGPCHQPSCVIHVTWGTPSQNMMDKHRDGTMTVEPGGLRTRKIGASEVAVKVSQES